MINQRTFSHLQADRLDAPEREEWLPVSDVLKQLDLRAGMTVADVGAGTGYFTLPMSSAVGDHGKIIAIDLQPEMLVRLQLKLGRRALTNVECRPGEASATGLPTNSCDFVLLANIWHELDHLPRVLAEVKRILCSNGRIAILDWRPGVEQPPGPPLHHRIPSMCVAEDVAIAGFSSVKNVDIGIYSYLILADAERGTTRG